jgi:hypothetical protein
VLHDPLCDTERVQDDFDPRVQRFTNLEPGKGRPIQNRDAQSCSAAADRGRRAGRPCAHNHDVNVGTPAHTANDIP